MSIQEVGGKYAIEYDEEQHRLRTYRNGEYWNEETGNKFLYCVWEELASLRKARIEFGAQVAIARDAVRANHNWHTSNDEYDGYLDSALYEQNMAALQLTGAEALLKIVNDKTRELQAKLDTAIEALAERDDKEARLEKRIAELEEGLGDIANNLGEAACGMPTQKTADVLSEFAVKAFSLLVASASAKGYWCVVCGHWLPEDEHGVIVHDDVPHQKELTFDEEERPQ